VFHSVTVNSGNISGRLKMSYTKLGLCTKSYGGHAVAQWLRHFATNWKVVGSIPDGVIGIFHLHNPTGRTLALGSIQPQTEMSTRNISLRYRCLVRRADNLATFMCRFS
jgi:hypothetical protein